MYDLEALKRKIAKIRLQQTILELSSTNLSPNFKKDLENSFILVNGYVNLTLLSSLA